MYLLKIASESVKISLLYPVAWLSILVSSGIDAGKCDAKKVLSRSVTGSGSNRQQRKELKELIFSVLREHDPSMAAKKAGCKITLYIPDSGKY